MGIDAQTRNLISLWFWLTMAWLCLAYIAFVIFFVGLPTT